ncbi:MAG: 16S rRNA (guanine(966)-N(2))-methyltransferase RsmD [Clostridia bacterium]
MRIITGIYGGRKLISPTNREVRPTPDRVKESLFNILNYELDGALVIDLFSGSGSLGIEALSRGAKKCYFCDNSGQSLALTKQNLSFVPISDYETIKADYKDNITRLGSRGVKANYIFCDPPYDLQLGTEILLAIEKSDLLAENGKIMIEHRTFDKPICSGNFDLVDQRKYGETTIDFYQKIKKIAITGTFDPFTKGHKSLVEYALERFDKVFVVMLVNPKKVLTYDKDARLEMIRASLQNYKNYVQIDYFEGLTIDYCQKNGIKYILRGIRNSEDMEYEKEIADYNYENGGIETIYMKALDKDISSTLVKENIEKDQSIDTMVDSDIINKLKKK